MTTVVLKRAAQNRLGDLAATANWWIDATSPDSISAIERAQLGTNVHVRVVDGDSVNETDALAATLTRSDAPAVVTPYVDSDGHIDHGAWMTTCAATRDLMYAWRGIRASPDALMDALPPAYRDFVDLVRQSSSVTLVAGPGAAACCLLIYEAEPDVLTRVRPLTRGISKVEEIVWDYLRINPVLPVRTGLNHDETGNLAVSLINAVIQDLGDSDAVEALATSAETEES